MAESLGIKQGSLSDIERGKIMGLSKRLRTLLEVTHKANIDYLFNNSDEMFLKEGELSAQRGDLSKFSTGEIIRYIIDNEATFKKHHEFKSYINVLVWDQLTKVVRQVYVNKLRLEESDKGDEKG